mmetsp:Transcript_16151/g.44118  ORF Transcript_16151/g.44118 Transcript_16151/m.44118 type:complete len:213 (+) Transcript_16151:4947-5585(+)
MRPLISSFTTSSSDRRSRSNASSMSRAYALILARDSLTCSLRAFSLSWVVSRADSTIRLTSATPLSTLTCSCAIALAVAVAMSLMLLSMIIIRSSPTFSFFVFASTNADSWFSLPACSALSRVAASSSKSCMALLNAAALLSIMATVCFTMVSWACSIWASMFLRIISWALASPRLTAWSDIICWLMPASMACSSITCARVLPSAMASELAC